MLISALLVRLPGHGCRASKPPGSASETWELPAAVLLPPALAVVAPAAMTASASRRIRGAWRSRAGPADSIVSAGFHALATPLHAPGTRAAQWLHAVVAAGDAMGAYLHRSPGGDERCPAAPPAGQPGAVRRGPGHLISRHQPAVRHPCRSPGHPDAAVPAACRSRP